VVALAEKDVEMFLPGDARTAKRGIAIVSRPSDHPSLYNVVVPWLYRLGYFESNYTNN